MFCASRVDNSPSLLERPQAVFLITDIDLFAHEVRKASNGLLGNYAWKRVEYGEVIEVFEAASPRAPSPFRKALRFHEDKEVRIVWENSRNFPAGRPLLVPKVAPLLDRIA
jgi:hypothetical protein